jgi:hypothetical protein
MRAHPAEESTMRAGYVLVFYVAGMLVWLLAVIEPRVPLLGRIRVNLVALGLLICFAPTAIQTLKEHLVSGPEGLF